MFDRDFRGEICCNIFEWLGVEEEEKRVDKQYVVKRQ